MTTNQVSNDGKEEGVGEERGRGKGEAAREEVHNRVTMVRKDSDGRGKENGKDGRDEGLRDLQGLGSIVEEREGWDDLMWVDGGQGHIEGDKINEGLRRGGMMSHSLGIVKGGGREVDRKVSLQEGKG